MKDKIYLRIAKSKRGYSYKVDKRRHYENLFQGNYHRIYFPTVCVTLNLEIPDNIFQRAQAELDLKIKEAEINSEIKIEQEKI